VTDENDVGQSLKYRRKPAVEFWIEKFTIFKLLEKTY